MQRDTFPELLRSFEQFLIMAVKEGVKLNPAKVKIGQSTGKFYGFNLSRKGMSPTAANLDPVVKMTAPTTQSEVRSILGIFVQFRHFFERYDRLVKPMQRLLKKDVQFTWTDECQAAMNTIRERLLSGKLYLAKPDPHKTLYLETDGSDDGWGAVLLQYAGDKTPEDATIEDRRIIKMWSKQWKTLRMQRAPPYYKEAKALINGLNLSRVYADANRNPIECYTDHKPLTWIKQTSGKGPVSMFQLDNLGRLRYNISYRKGTDNTFADAASRFPCLGPKQLDRAGTIEALDVLLPALGEFCSEERVWIHTYHDKRVFNDIVRAWTSTWTTKPKRVPMTDKPTAEKIVNCNYGLALWAPAADNATQVLDAALHQDKPFAILLPSCLVNAAPSSKTAQSKLARAAKITLLDAELTWVIGGIEGTKHHCFRSSVMTLPAVTSFQDLRGILQQADRASCKQTKG